MDHRQKISQKLHELLGTDEVHFQPAENVKLKYPCIIYEFDGFYTLPADNSKYMVRPRYTVTHIYLNPDRHLRGEMLSSFLFVQHDRTYKADNLYHDVYAVYI
jgi:hypothetical protein